MARQEHIHQMVQSSDPKIRRDAALAIQMDFHELPDKNIAWNDLLDLVRDLDSDVRVVAAKALGSSFSKVLDRNTAWIDLLNLVRDQNSNVRQAASDALNSSFSEVPDKNKAWLDLLDIIRYADINVRWAIADVLGSLFTELPDKNAAWLNLHNHIRDSYENVRWAAAHVLGSLFTELPDKNAAWLDLHDLIRDPYDDVRWAAAHALSSSFSEVLDKNAAWLDLHDLIRDSYRNVRRTVAHALGLFFSEIPDKNEALNDLNYLIQDPDSSVKCYAYHSLGRVSVYRATEADNDDIFRKEIENAINFFETSLNLYFSPSRFCLPFYKSFYAITFQKSDVQVEVDHYIKEAKNASKGQKNKEALVEIIENLSFALLEVNRLKDAGLDPLDFMKKDLNFYRHYCDRACELLDKTEYNAPRSVKVLRRGLPIIDSRIKLVLKEIEDQAYGFRQAAEGTPLQYSSDITFESAKGLGEIQDEHEACRVLKKLFADTRGCCESLPQEVRERVCGQLNWADSDGYFEKGMAISGAISALTTYANTMKESSQEKQKLLEYNNKKIMAKLNEIDFSIIRQGQIFSNYSSETISKLGAFRSQFESMNLELKILEGGMVEMDASVKESLTEFNNDIDAMVNSLKILSGKLPRKEDQDLIFQKLNEFQEDKAWTWASRIGSLATIITLFL